MKKLTAMILTLALLICAVALAESADFLGTWYLNEINFGGSILAPSVLGMDMTLEINEDGTAVLTSVEGEEDALQNATWTLEGDVVTVTVLAEGDEEEGETMTMTIQDGVLVAEEGGMGLNFGREKVEAEVYQPGAPVADAADADYAGQWQATYMDMNGNYIQAAMFAMELTVTVDESSMTLTGMYVFDNDALDITYVDGALTHEGKEDEMYGSIIGQLLDDGTMQLSFLVEDGDPLVLIMEKAE